MKDVHTPLHDSHTGSVNSMIGMVVVLYNDLHTILWIK